MSNQHEIKYMLGSLKLMHEKIGGPNTKKSLGGTQFDIIQEEFLSKRHEIEKLQDQKERQGLTTKNADIAFRIREGTKELKDLLQKLRRQYERLVKKKKETPTILQNKKKIVENCELLYKDIEERLYGDANPNSYTKPQTLTDMKAKCIRMLNLVLNEIDTANYNIMSRSASEDKLSELNEQEMQAMQTYKKKDEQIDIVLDEIIVGVGGLRKKVKNINEKQDEIAQKVEQGNKKMTSLEKRIKTDNEKLKVIIEKVI